MLWSRAQRQSWPCRYDKHFEGDSALYLEHNVTSTPIVGGLCNVGTCICMHIYISKRNITSAAELSLHAQSASASILYVMYYNKVSVYRLVYNIRLRPVRVCVTVYCIVYIPLYKLYYSPYTYCNLHEYINDNIVHMNKRIKNRE